MGKAGFALGAVALGIILGGEPGSVLARGVEAGGRAPSLNVSAVIQGPEPSQLEESISGGSALVLEFWATWCGPCVASIPHWNDLVQEFEGRPVHFLSVTDDPEERVRSFLERRSLAGWIAIDEGHTTLDAYGVNGIPLTVLIDSEGTIQAVTQPSRVTPEMIERLVDGRAIQSTPIPDVEKELGRRLGGATDTTPFFRAEVRSALEGPPVMSAGDDFFHAFRYPALTVMTIAFDIPRTRILGDPGLPPAGDFDFIFSTPGRPERLLPSMQQALESAFGFAARWEEQEMEALILRRKPGREPALPVARGDHGGSRISSSSIEGFGLDSGGLALLLEKALARPVLDETGLEGRFDAALKWDPEVPGAAGEAIREQWALDLAVERRNVRLLRLEAK